MVSMYAYINPVIAVILGWLILNERFDWVMITSTMVVLFGVVLVKTASAEKSAYFAKPLLIAIRNRVRNKN